MAMQISPANFLIAAQQGTRAAPAAKAGEKPRFEPLAFKQAGPAPQIASPAPVAAVAPPGSQIDIRV